MKKVICLFGYVLVFVLIACSNSTEPDEENNKEDIITISSVEQFIEFADSVNRGNDYSHKTVVLGTDIILNDTTNWKTWDETTTGLNHWNPIGSSGCFRGTFDGAGHKISGIYINSTEDYQGLFGCLTRTIKNVKVNASYIKGEHYVGGIAGYSNSDIMNSSFEGIIIGRRKVGGIAGFSEDGNDITNSYFIGKINAGGYVGGIVGENQGKVLNCYSKGEIKGHLNIGGIVGYNWYGIIENNYSVATINIRIEDEYSDGGGGGLIGWNHGALTNGYFLGTVHTNIDIYIGSVVGFNGIVFIGTINKTYWNIDVAYGKVGLGEGSGNTDVDIKGITTDDMKSPSFVEILNVFVDSANAAQTNFTYSKWALDTQGINQGYPVLLLNP